MAAARYWRINQIDTFAGGDLVLSDVALSDSGGRVDAAATITSTRAPISGSLAALQDGAFTPTVTFAAADVALPGFALVWDFGPSPKDIVQVGVAGPAPETYLHRFTLQSSTDGVTWAGVLSVTHTIYPGVAALGDQIVSEADPYAGSTVLLLTGGVGGLPFADLGLFSRGIYVNSGTPTVSDQSALTGVKSIYLNGTSALSALPSTDFAFGDGDFTVELYLHCVFPHRILTNRADGAASGTWSLRVGKNQEIIFSEVVSGEPGLTTAPGAVPANTWAHLAVSRSAAVLRAFVDGVIVGSAVNTTVFSNASNNLLIGRSAPSETSYFAGYLQEVRITKGVARYTDNFTPPARCTGDVPQPRSHITFRDLDLFGPAVGDTRLLYQAPASIALDAEDGGVSQITNTISRLGVPGRYRVRLFDRRSGRCVRETWSADDGTYSFPGIAHRPAGYFVVGYDHSGTPVNASISDLLTPEPML